MNPEDPLPKGPSQKRGLKKRRVFWIGGGIALLFALSALLTGYWLRTSGYQRIASSQLGKALETQARVGDIAFGLKEGNLALTLTDVYLYEPGSQEKAILVPQATLDLEPLKLAGGQLHLRRAILQRPVIRLFRDQSGEVRLLGSPVSDFLKKAGKGWKIGPFSLETVKELEIEGGRIEMVDRFAPRHPPSPLSAVMNLTAQGLSPLHPWSFQGKGRFLTTGLDEPWPTFQVVGRLGLTSSDSHPSGSSPAQIELTLKDFRPELIRGLFPSGRSWPQVRGRMDLTLTYAGKSIQEFQSSGRVDLRSLVFDDSRIFREPFHLSNFFLSYEGQRRGDRLHVKGSLEDKGTAPERLPLTLQGGFTLRGLSLKPRWLEVALSSSPFSLEESKRYLPWKGMSPRLASFLGEDLSKGHIVSLEVKGSGRPEELSHVERAIHAGLLSARLAFEELTYCFSPHFPPAENLRGSALLENGRFSFRDLQGSSRSSRLMEGRGTLVLHPHRSPLDLDLKLRLNLEEYLSTLDFDSLSPRFASLRQLKGLKGQGDLDLLLSGWVERDYPENFQGKMTLSEGEFSHDRLPLRLSHLHGPVSFDAQVIQTSSLEGMAGSSPFSLRATVDGHQHPRPKIDLALKASLAARDLNNLLPAGLLPELAAAKPLDLQLSLQGTSEELKVRQELDLTPAFYSTFAGEKPPALSNRLFLEGLWKRGEEEKRLDIQTLVFSLPSSQIRGEGHIRLEPHPHLQLSLQVPRFSLPELAQLAWGEEGWSGDAHLSGAFRLDGPWEEPGKMQILGQLELRGRELKIPQLTAPLEQLQASLSSNGERVSLRSGQLRVNGSPFSITGEFLRSPRLEGRFQLVGRELNLDQLLRKASSQEDVPQVSQEKASKGPEGLPRAHPRDPPDPGGDLVGFLSRQLKANPIFQATWEGQIDLGTLTFRSFPFQGIHIVGSAGSQQLDLSDLAFRLDRGRVQLKTLFRSPLEGRPTLKLAIQAIDLDTQAALKRLGLKEDLLSSSFYLEGTLSGTGETEEQILGSLEGKASLELKKGRLHRFSWLSRIFSLMNLYQLVQARLPDLTTEGMPFDGIRGDFTLKKGVARTENFLLQSPAMSMSAVGDLSLPKGTLKMIVGVQPFQTLEKVVGLVPFVGYILIGEDKKLVVAYFQVKGKIGDPKVTPRPIDTLSKGILGVVERTLRLPMELPHQIPIIGKESFWKRIYRWIKFW